MRRRKVEAEITANHDIASTRQLKARSQKPQQHVVLFYPLSQLYRRHLLLQASGANPPICDVIPGTVGWPVVPVMLLFVAFLFGLQEKRQIFGSVANVRRACRLKSHSQIVERSLCDTMHQRLHLCLLLLISDDVALLEKCEKVFTPSPSLVHLRVSFDEEQFHGETLLANVEQAAQVLVHHLRLRVGRAAIVVDHDTEETKHKVAIDKSALRSIPCSAMSGGFQDGLAFSQRVLNIRRTLTMQRGYNCAVLSHQLEHAHCAKDLGLFVVRSR